MRQIDSFDHPELQPYRTMRRQGDHREQGIFVAEGEKVVRRLLASRFEVVSALLPAKWYEDLRPLFEDRPEIIEVFIGEKRLLETLTGFSMYQGLLACGKVPRQRSLRTIMGDTPQPALLAAADGLSNAENLGALVRNCAAFSVGGLLVGETCASPYLRRAVRSSMGTVFELPIFEAVNLAEALGFLRAQGMHIVGAHPHSSGRTLSTANFSNAACVVFGSEGHGISPEIQGLCDECVAIPMAPRVDSLNVASAAAAFLYEANRQRRRM